MQPKTSLCICEGNINATLICVSSPNLVKLQLQSISGTSSFRHAVKLHFNGGPKLLERLPRTLAEPRQNLDLTVALRQRELRAGVAAVLQRVREAPAHLPSHMAPPLQQSCFWK